MNDFSFLCEKIRISIESDWESSAERLSIANQELKNALQGDINSEMHFKEVVLEKLNEFNNSDHDYPSFYASLEDAIYHENWGYAGMAEWFEEKYATTSSAKIIGKRIYFLINGSMKLMPQKISDERRAQLVSKLLSIKPDERKDKDFHEIYLHDGTRITIYNESMCKSKEDSIIFRRYTVPTYTFEEQVLRGTISENMIPLFKAMVKLGVNVAFTGAVRTAKSTFLSTWQSYEDQNLEGVMVETDPEIPLHKIMPEAPIIQIVADGENLKNVCKRLMRSDADYIIMAEARDGIALEAAVRVANKGTRRCKMTFHNKEPLDFCYDVATEIIKSEGGSIRSITEWVAMSVDYIFHFIQLKDKSKKRLNSIHEVYFDREKRQIIITKICKYNGNNDNWSWFAYVNEQIKKDGRIEDEISLDLFEEELKKLENLNPMNQDNQVEHYSISYS